MDDLLKELMPTFIDYCVRVVGVLFAIWLSFRIAGWAERRVTTTLARRNFDPALTLFFGSMVRWLLIIAAVVACLGVVGIETTSFAAIIGAAGLAIGLAFQGTLSNFSAGVMLLTFRPFTVGDVVKIDGVIGSVVEIGLFTTAINTGDNRRVIVPNSKVTDGTIENFTHNDSRRVDIAVGVSYDSNLDEVRRVLEATAAAIPGRLADKGHQVILLKLNDSSIDWQVRIWCKTADYWSVWDTTILAVKQSLDGAKVSIPFPQMDVHLERSA